MKLTSNHIWKKGYVIRIISLLICLFMPFLLIPTDSQAETQSIHPQQSNAGGSYLVYPINVENPLHGERRLISNPADPIASPYGWHDTDGVAGAEYTITRGNNAAIVYVNTTAPHNAYNEGDLVVDGGPTLTFAPELDLTVDPQLHPEAAITQMFYSINALHDLFYRYGFDEASGNFQHNNYERGGIGGDAPIVSVQEMATIDGWNVTPGFEGKSPTMMIYRTKPRSLITVHSPNSIAGEYWGGSTAYIMHTEISGALVLAQDAVAPASDACTPLTNGAAMNGNIAFLDRGNCDYAVQIKNATDSGAIAVVIANNLPGNEPMHLHIAHHQAFTLSYEQGQRFHNALSAGPISLSVQAVEQDAAYDNYAVAQMYSIAMAFRLPLADNSTLPENCGFDSGLLFGWSNTFANVVTARPTDTATTPRGTAAWIYEPSVRGVGFTTYPYTTDLAVNPWTFGDLDEHDYGQPGLNGEIWASILWEVYWNLTNTYGFTPDMMNGTGGNTIMLQLMIEGLKLGGCTESYIDVRDALLKADQQLYGSGNQCLIWQGFAKRGLGAGARQALENNSPLYEESFDVPECTSYQRSYLPYIGR